MPSIWTDRAISALIADSADTSAFSRDVWRAALELARTMSRESPIPFEGMWEAVRLLVQLVEASIKLSTSGMAGFDPFGLFLRMKRIEEKVHE